MTDAPSPAARKPGRAWVGWLVRLAISALVLTVKKPLPLSARSNGLPVWVIDPG